MWIHLPSSVSTPGAVDLIDTCKPFQYSNSMPAHRKDNTAEKMYALYQQGASLAQVATRFQITRQAVYKYFTRRGWKLRKRQFSERQVIFNGHKYTPTRKGGYWGRTRGGTRQLLHRDVWEFHNGPISTGLEIHHLDGNRSNNEILNLELVTKAEHTARYSPHCNGSKHRCGK